MTGDFIISDSSQHPSLKNTHTSKQISQTSVHPKIQPVQWFLKLLLLLFSRSVVSDSLQPRGLQLARLPCPSPSPRVCSNSCPWSRSWHRLKVRPSEVRSKVSKPRWGVPGQSQTFTREAKHGRLQKEHAAQNNRSIEYVWKQEDEQREIIVLMRRGLY